MLNKNGRKNLDLEGRLIKISVIENWVEKGITDNKHNTHSMTQNSKNYKTENKRPSTNNMIKSNDLFMRDKSYWSVENTRK
jgi:hypothetical protein